MTLSPTRVTFFLFVGAFTVLVSTVGFAREVSFSWQPINNAVSYEIQVSDTEDFEKPLLEDKVGAITLTATLKPGKYFFRVRGIDNKDAPGPWSALAPLTVNPASPALKTPDENFSTSMFDSGTTVEFSWEPTEGATLYEFVIRDPNKHEVIDATSPTPTYSTAALLDGKYTWQVRSVTKDEVSSEFSEPRSFQIIKSPLAAPQLLSPDDKTKMTTHHPVTFVWNQDGQTKVTDLYIERLDGNKKVEKIANVGATAYTTTFETAGHYKWYVVTKESEKSLGIAATPRLFHAIYDPLHHGNYELELNYSYVSDHYGTSSSQQSGVGNQIGQQSTSFANFGGFSFGYYITRGWGFYLSARAGNVMLENTSVNEQESDATMRLRFGANGFAQEYWFGYRKMDILEAENNPSASTLQFTTTGPLIGTRMIATVNPKWRIPFIFYYYKPLATSQNLASFNADVVGGSIGAKYNFSGNWWLGYRFAYEGLTANYNFPNQPQGTNANWDMNRIEPLYFSISFEH